jgi:hypothetical protein
MYEYNTYSSRIQDPGSASKNLSILAPKKWFITLGNMIRVVHPGSASRILIFYPSRIPGSKMHRIRNTGDNYQISYRTYTNAFPPQENNLGREEALKQTQ